MKNTGNLTVTTPSDREIAMSRVFDAPRHLVFDAYTTCEYLKRWLGVFGGWSLDVCKIDLRVGGSYRYGWRNVNGNEMGMGGIYRELVIGERIVATEKFDESWYEGEAVDTTTFSETNGKTTLTTTVRYASKAARDGVLKSRMTEGMTAGFDALAELLAHHYVDRRHTLRPQFQRSPLMKNTGTLEVTLPSDREVRLTRVFDAPRSMVYDAMTKPELLKRWFGPHGFSLIVCEIDLRVGGRWRFVLEGPDGRTMGMGGVYVVLTPPNGSIHTEAFDDFPGEARITTVLTEENGKTTLVATSLAPSKEIRDAVIASGMEHGAAETYDRLAELLSQQLATTP